MSHFWMEGEGRSWGEIVSTQRRSSAARVTNFLLKIAKFSFTPTGAPSGENPVGGALSCGRFREKRNCLYAVARESRLVERSPFRHFQLARISGELEPRDEISVPDLMHRSDARGRPASRAREILLFRGRRISPFTTRKRVSRDRNAAAARQSKAQIVTINICQMHVFLNAYRELAEATSPLLGFTVGTLVSLFLFSFLLFLFLLRGGCLSRSFIRPHASFVA